MDYQKIAPMMGWLWAPIAAVTSSWNGKDNAQIAVAIGGASIVADRPRVAVQLYKTNFTHQMVFGSGAFALCFLRQDQLELVHGLGFVSGRDRDKLTDVPFQRKASGSPVLADCFGYLDCRVVNVMDGGDMTVFLADVLEGETRSEGEPLTWQHMRAIMPRMWNDEWARKIAGEVEVSRRTMDQIRPVAWPKDVS
ncbi:MAG: flavin reductase family protein [Dehalococcoidia bacterium]